MTDSTPPDSDLDDLLASLPERLLERVHAHAGAAARGDEEFVLYWMRTAVRGHENPALDVALDVAGELGVGVLVYHALSERYPFASDRHHRFILDGARDVEEELAERGVPYAFHLQREGSEASCRAPHLKTLAGRASVVVTEDASWAPLRRWTDAVTESTAAPVLLVDTACVYPSRRVPRSAAGRAYRIRKEVSSEWDRRIAAGWSDARVPGTAWGAGGPPSRVDSRTAAQAFDLPFEPMDFRDPDGRRLDDDAWHVRVSDWIARCRIDHAVPPIPGSPGGSRAGYARWAAFRARGLKGYARTRNDALADGVSRMSPYLHYGHVSPLRIAREASRVGGKGPEKYLDELLVWRELAHAFCLHDPDHDSVRVLPDWARETLAEHESDERPELLSWEQLARGESGDPLWDAAQRSLLIHGELHNNVRMTWGKAVLRWTPDAATALRMLIDLNHRYALDGRDPNSYGGILWCLGALDRPFEPEKPIFGRVRPRSTEQHARRLDVDEYARRTGRPTVAETPRVVVIGAGVAGLACARSLADQGWDVVVVDKGRRPGGRTNTRTSRDDDARRFDHGAQYFTARDPRFRRHVISWARQGWVAEWTASILRVEGSDESEILPPRDDDPRWVAVPGMQTLCDALAKGLDVRCGVRVSRLERADRWSLVTDEGDVLDDFDAVVVTAPPAQAADLFDSVDDGTDDDFGSDDETSAAVWAAEARDADVAPTWAAMFEFDPRDAPTGLTADALLDEEGAVAWAARDSSKPGRPTDAERWVVHGSSAFSTRHLEEAADRVADRLLDGFRSLVERAGGSVGTPRWSAAHRWRYALVRSGPDGDCRCSDTGLAWAGDVFDAAGRARVEAAWLSGVASAGRLLNRAAGGTPAPHPGQAANEGVAGSGNGVAQGSLFA
ncbi:MAG TPA: FAD-dependent oxidoreductase [Longimicrobiales bacterium]|nr:FAD-dependent oxidoreductase [Longimicrobiales bacterium]